MFETAAVFLMRDVATQSFHEPRLEYIYIDFGFYSTTTLLSPLNMASGVSPTRNPIMHSDVQALLIDL